jgi:pimeloyl-ACP methyl ester carboxylesterase
MTTFVLVHGTGCGGWVWQRVTPLLRAAGYEVYTPTLTGVGDRSHLLGCGVDLTMHITDVASLLLYEDLTEVVLVGHSYAGMVITGVAAQVPERLKLLIYLDAYVPEAGQTESDLWPAEMRAGIQAEEAAASGLRPPPDPAWLGITEPELADWARARMTPHPLATYNEPVAAGDARSAALPRAYIHCTGVPTSPVFAPFAGKARAEGWPVGEIATSHMAMLTAPREMARYLQEFEDAR